MAIASGSETARVDCRLVPLGEPPALLPPGAIYSAFSIGRMQLPFVAAAPLIGANVRVGLEDNIYMSRGVLATNGRLHDAALALLRR